jgi:chromosome segregation ATPase
MKVTQEMVDRANSFMWNEPYTRALLEAALADVPEPGELTERYELLRQDYAGADADRRSLSARVKELEAKLVSTRAVNSAWQDNANKALWSTEDRLRFAEDRAKAAGAIVKELEAKLDSANKRIAELEARAITLADSRTVAVNREDRTLSRLVATDRALQAVWERAEEAEAKLAAVRELAENLPEEDWQDPPGCGWHGAFSEAADMLKAILDK